MDYNSTILLIDDDTDDQEIFSIAVGNARKDIQCVFADDGIDALAKLTGDKNFIPDFIFIDMNMPRMNGTQCLEEIKKIEKLRHVPVYMYSTSADPNTVAKNIKLGAADFIVKPPDIKVLTNILSDIFQKKLLLMMFCIIWLFALPEKINAQTDTLPAVKELKKLSVEELMDIVVTSVSKSPERLTDAAAAIQVITAEDVHRSCATRLPEALRLATNMQAAQSGSHDWGITARGFKGSPVASSSLADKLLVMIDGRSVYTPLFAGVYWDVQNVMLEDLDRIEVISGPGGAQWGANAMNGIVNIISKDAKETQGLYAGGSMGSFLKYYGGARYGGHIDTTLYYRVYGQHFNYTNTTIPDTVDIDAGDEWSLTQGGFRMDYKPSGKNKFTFLGDLYSGTEDDTSSTLVNGQNLVLQWSHSISKGSTLSVQTYFDRTYRNMQRQDLRDIMTTYDIEFQHNIQIGTRNRFSWGGNYRSVHDEAEDPLHLFQPATVTLPYYSLFVQDQLTIIPEKLDLTLGTKVLHNDYTDFEYHPTIRIAYRPDSLNTIWAAVSRAVRTPSRLDADYVSPILGSYGDFHSENVIAYEIGYRRYFGSRVYFSIAAYYNEYTDLRSIDTNLVAPPFYYFANHMEATTYGLEPSMNVVLSDWWRVRAGYSYIHEEFRYTSPNTYPNSDILAAIDPKNQFLIQSITDLGKSFEVDAVIRYVDVLPTRLNGVAVPAYGEIDLRVAWKYKWLTAAVLGQNLAHERHAEFGNREIPRRFMINLTVRF